jgi:hypothetical protein
MASWRNEMSVIGSPTGALGHVYDSKELNVSMAKKAMPPVIGVFIFVTVFFGFVFGTVLFYDGAEAWGITVYVIAAVASVLMLAGWRVMTRR